MEKTKNLYYIYHIPGKKIGMTRNIYNRVIKCQGYKPGEFQILESSYDKEFIETNAKSLSIILRRRLPIDLFQIIITFLKNIFYHQGNNLKVLNI